MFKCKHCEKEFESKGLLLAHYREHKAEETSRQIEETANMKEKAIPIEFCPPEVKLLGEGRYIGLRVLGMKKGDKLIIQDIKLI